VEGGDDSYIRIGPNSASFITNFEGHNWRNQVSAEDGSDGVGLSEHTSQHTSQEAGFIFSEDQASHISNSLTLPLVNANEEGVGVFSSCFKRGSPEGETDGDDDVIVFIDEELNVGHVVFGVFGFDVIDDGTKLSFSQLHTFPSGLVEGLIINLTNISHQTNA